MDVINQEHPAPLVESVAKTYRRLFNEIYRPVLDQMMDVSKKAEELSLEDAVDLGFLCRELYNQFDELRKEVKARQEKIGRFIATALVNQLVSGSDEDVFVRGIYASGTPDVGVVPKLPKKGTQEYMDLCEHFGITSELAQRGLVVWHYPQIAEYCTELAKEGKKMPPGVDGNATKLATIFRRRQHGKT